jgi:TRAP-type mannitol/chloroaromatic compound transport system permease small subunit
MNRIERVTSVIDWVSLWSGRAVAWLIVPMILLLAGEVIARKFWAPTVWTLDVATMLYGVHFFVAGAMTLYLGKHIRTDFFYSRWSPRTQAWVDVFCYLFLFLPGMVMFVVLSWEFAAESWELRESLMTTWRPAAYWYKSAIPLSGALLLVQGIAEMLKSVNLLLTGIDRRHHSAASEAT